MQSGHAGYDLPLDLLEDQPIEGLEVGEEVDAAGRVINAFVKAIKALLYYPADNPLVKRFRDEFMSDLGSFLTTYYTLTIEVSETQFCYQDIPLYTHTNLRSSLPFLLYNDGLREIRFVEGFEEWEIQGLVKVISERDQINQSEDDIVTMLWEQEFVHIDYLAIDDFLENSLSFVPENPEEFQSRFVGNQLFHDDTEFEEERFAGLPDQVVAAGDHHTLSTPLANASIYTLTEGELELLRREVEEETSTTAVFNFVDVLFDIFLASDDQDILQDSGSVLTRVVDSMVITSEFRRASDLLQRIKEMIEKVQLTPMRHSVLRYVITHAGERNSIEHIAKILQGKEMPPLNEVQRYLLLLDSNAIPSLGKLLGDSQNAQVRRMLCDVLPVLGRDCVEALFPLLDSSRWFLVRNIAYILGRTGRKEAAGPLIRTFNHKDARVRREVVTSLGLVGDAHAETTLIQALEDSDEGVRSLTASSLGLVGGERALSALLRIVRSKGFAHKDPAEIDAVFSGIGGLQLAAAVPVLKQLLTGWHLLDQRKAHHLRAGAARALAMIGLPNAVAVLTMGSQSKNSAVRGACMSALQLLPTTDRPGELSMRGKD